MKRFEGNGDLVTWEPVRPKNTEDIKSFESEESLKDYLFDQYMKQQVVEDFFTTMDEYLEPDDVDLVRELLTEYGDEVIYATLSLPHELRPQVFNKMAERIENGEDAKEIFREFVERSSRHNFGIGYHTSPVDVRPDESGSWQIKGTEPDHRDNDRMMAYYSDKYRHLYKKKHPKFIYVVRTDPQTHKTDGNWSRSDILSVVMRVPFEDVFQYVEKVTRETKRADDQSN